MYGKVAAIITLYNPNLESFLINLETLLPQVDLIYIMDNSEETHISKQIEALLKKYDSKISYIKMPYNKGLSAINDGVKLAIKEEADHVLLLDQDSRPESNMVSKLIEGLNHVTNRLGMNVAAIGPTHIDKNTGKPFKRNICCLNLREKPITDNLIEVDQLPTSGMLIPISVFKNVGYLCDKLFLDITDFEWCWRAKKKGMCVIRHREAFIIHELGIGTKRFFTLRI